MQSMSCCDLPFIWKDELFLVKYVVKYIYKKYSAM